MLIIFIKIFHFFFINLKCQKSQHTKEIITTEVIFFNKKIRHCFKKNPSYVLENIIQKIFFNVKIFLSKKNGNLARKNL